MSIIRVDIIALERDIEKKTKFKENSSKKKKGERDKHTKMIW